MNQIIKYKMKETEEPQGSEYSVLDIDIKDLLKVMSKKGQVADYPETCRRWIRKNNPNSGVRELILDSLEGAKK
jgi:hypothetical protein